MPALSDGRLTNWVSRCEYNSIIQRHFNISSESQYRTFLQQNPQLVQDFTRQYFVNTAPLPYFNTTPCVTAAQFTPTPRPGGW